MFFPLASDQKLILSDACITRGVRAVVGVPKLVGVPKAVFLFCLMEAVQTLVAVQAGAG